MSAMAERGRTFRIRWTVPMDVLVTVTVRADELDDDSLESAEEYAYDLAVERAKERLEQVSATVNGVGIHGDIDGCSADEVEHVTSPGEPS